MARVPTPVMPTSIVMFAAMVFATAAMVFATAAMVFATAPMVFATAAMVFATRPTAALATPTAALATAPAFQQGLLSSRFLRDPDLSRCATWTLRLERALTQWVAREHLQAQFRAGNLCARVALRWNWCRGASFQAS